MIENDEEGAVVGDIQAMAEKAFQWQVEGTEWPKELKNAKSPFRYIGNN